ncbi:WYL domain-containing protein [Nocardia sp. NPDC052001]|uniref:WYL domain-containing protein n=1 Tax=Nocardia sp. NPDC052001 TaxID=3154853 RepID=UPI00341F1329
MHPYGLVAHSGRWYVTGKDGRSSEARQFRLDRIGTATVLSEIFTPPAGFDASAHLLSSLATAPHRYEVSILVQGTPVQVRPLLPEAIATVQQVDSSSSDAEPWVRVQIRAEQLDWIPPLLAGLHRRFVIEQPAELNDALRDLARRLTAAADGRPAGGME